MPLLLADSHHSHALRQQHIDHWNLLNSSACTPAALASNKLLSVLHTGAQGSHHTPMHTPSSRSDRRCGVIVLPAASAVLPSLS